MGTYLFYPTSQHIPKFYIAINRIYIMSLDELNGILIPYWTWGINLVYKLKPFLKQNIVVSPTFSSTC